MKMQLKKRTHPISGSAIAKKEHHTFIYQPQILLEEDPKEALG